MNNNEVVTYGLIGTAVSATGAGLSVNDIQAIVSITVTVLGFLISVIIPLGIKLYKKTKEALKDNKLTKEEVEDIAKTGKEIVDKTKQIVEDIKHGND